MGYLGLIVSIGVPGWLAGWEGDSAAVPGGNDWLFRENGFKRGSKGGAAGRLLRGLRVRADAMAGLGLIVDLLRGTALGG